MVPLQCDLLALVPFMWEEQNEFANAVVLQAFR